MTSANSGEAFAVRTREDFGQPVLMHSFSSMKVRHLDGWHKNWADKKKIEEEANFISLRALEWIFQHSNLAKLPSPLRRSAQALCPSPHTETLLAVIQDWMGFQEKTTDLNT